MTDPVNATLDLVRAAQQGDRPALDALFARYYPRVLKIVRLRMGQRVRRHFDSGDLLQETFAAAVRGFDRFEMRDEASLIHWLARLAEHRIVTAAEYGSTRKRDDRKELALDAATSATASHALRDMLKADTLVPLDKMIRAEDQAAVEECLTELPEAQREVLVLRNYVGMPFADVAREMGRPSEGAARMLHAKAMLALARRVREHLGRDA